MAVSVENLVSWSGYARHIYQLDGHRNAYTTHNGADTATASIQGSRPDNTSSTENCAATGIHAAR
jgi:hypothetical protein